jgi:tRNA(Ile)-lysidine synthase
MRFIRGAGPRGLSGIAPKRRLAPGITLIRPMLDITRADAEAICTAAGVPWVIDATNADRARLRAALRHGVIPALRAVAPDIAATAGRVAAVQREVARELERAAANLLSQAHAHPSALGGSDSGEVRLSRASFSAAPRAVAELALRRIITRAGQAPDAISTRTLKQLLAAIHSNSGEAKNFEFPNATVRLDASSLVIRPRT